MLEGIQAKGRAAVLYAKGCAVRDTQDANIEAAVEVAQKADAIVLVVGGSSARDFKTSYEDTGAAIVDEHVSDMDCGEGYDRATLGLLGRQEELMQRIYALGKPVVTVYICGRPMEMNIASEQSDALLLMWYPGMEGGSALADILWGDYNPSGKLPISIPRSVGQIPVYHSQPVTGDYVEESSKPLYPFGYGLSYAQFEYGELETNGDEVAVTVTNIGAVAGEEVVQLYAQEHTPGLALSSEQLVAFQRVRLKAGETRKVSFSIKKAELSQFYIARRD